MMSPDEYRNTLKRDSRMCHDSSSVFSFMTETRYLNFIFCMNGANRLVFFFILLTGSVGYLKCFFENAKMINIYKSNEKRCINKTQDLSQCFVGIHIDSLSESFCFINGKHEKNAANPRVHVV